MQNKGRENKSTIGEKVDEIYKSCTEYCDYHFEYLHDSLYPWQTPKKPKIEIKKALAFQKNG